MRRQGVTESCAVFVAQRAGRPTYPFPFRMPAHSWPALPKETRYVVAAPLGDGVLGTCDCVAAVDRPPPPQCKNFLAAQRLARGASSARYSQAMVAAASAVI